jgi:uncharacterized membrane protein YfhO
MQKRIESLKKACIKNIFHILAFIIPVVSMLVIYYFKDIGPFGGEMYLRSDCYHQYAPFLQVLQDKFRNFDSLFYSWEFGGGMNFWGLAAYYAASPFNLLTLIWPWEITDFVSFSILLKMGLAGFTTSYYLEKHFKKDTILTTAFGCAYALSSFFAAYSWNIMWLDCLWMLPLIILGLEKLVAEKKCKMYAITLGIALFSNYYIGFMLCIFSVIYFIYLFFTHTFDPENKRKDILITLKNYAVFSLLGGGVSAVMSIPAYMALMNTVSAETDWRDLQEYFSVFYVFLRSLIVTPIAELKNYPDPNVYCTVAAFVLIPLFCLCKQINIKERVGKTAIAVFLLLSMCFNLPTYLWHGLHYPNSLSARFSFLYIFIIVVMCFEAAIHIKDFEDKHIIGAALGSSALILLCKQLYNAPSFLEELYHDSETADGTYIKMVYGSIAFICIYVILMIWYRKKESLKGFISYIMIVVVFLELTYNLAYTTIMSTQPKDPYYQAVQTYDELNKIAEKDSEQKFYRAQTATFNTKNDGARYRYNGISTFCSVSLASTQKYFDAIGLQVSTNSYSHYGITPVTAALYSIKYEYTTSTPTFANSETFIASSTKGPATQLYKFNETLPLGFMIKSNSMAKMKTDVIVEQSKTNKKGEPVTNEAGQQVMEDIYVTDPFAVQNSFVMNASGSATPVFHKLKAESGVITAAYDETDTSNTNAPKASSYDVYFYCMTSSDSITATINGATVELETEALEDDSVTTTTGANSQTFTETNTNHICHVGDVPAGSTITLSDTAAVCYAYAFDSAAWTSAYNVLIEQPLKVTSFKDSKIEGEIDVKEKGILYTSIPYEDGWTVYVDGKKAEAAALCADSLIGVVLTGGHHTVTFKYTPAGFVPGLALTLLSIIALALPYATIWELIEKKKKQQQKTPAQKN